MAMLLIGTSKNISLVYCFQLPSSSHIADSKEFSRHLAIWNHFENSENIEQIK